MLGCSSGAAREETRPLEHRAVVSWIAPGALALLLLGGASPVLAQVSGPEDYALRVEYLLWSPRPEGTIQKGLGEADGSLVDVRDVLAVAEGDANVLRASFRLGGGWKLRGSWTPLDMRGDTPSPEPFTYGTLVVRAGDRVVTTLKGNDISAGLEWDFVERPEGFFGLVFGVKYLDVDTVLVDVTTESRVAEREQLPVPVVGLAGRRYLGSLASVEGEISGITVGSRGHLWEWLVAVRVHLLDSLAATGGYRSLSLEGRDDRDSLDLGLATWTFGVEISL